MNEICKACYVWDQVKKECWCHWDGKKQCSMFKYDVNSGIDYVEVIDEASLLCKWYIKIRHHLIKT